MRQHTVETRFAGPGSTEWLTQIAGVTNVALGADMRSIQLHVQGTLAEVIHIAGIHNATNITTHEPTLEEVFLRFYEPTSPMLAG